MPASAPAKLADVVDTIVILILENRSFDHMLGHLSLFEGRTDVEGLRLPMSAYARPGDPSPFQLYDRAMDPDDNAPAHERSPVAMQMSERSGGTPEILLTRGFVDAYAHTQTRPDPHKPTSLGYYTRYEVPITTFLAENFMVCDHWFSAIPTSTQPNRLMAMAGETRVDATVSGLLLGQRLVYDWLAEKGISWRVYSESLPFFSLMVEERNKWIVDPDKFRRLRQLASDLADDATPFPQVVFIEPTYQDIPSFLRATPPDDNHPPAPVSAGEHLLRSIYTTLTKANPKRWQKMLWIVTYDEHGGFYDHVVPPACETRPPADHKWDSPQAFTTTGLRVPGLLVSPWLQRAGVFKESIDHTALLSLLADKFGGGSYSPAVDTRRIAGNSIARLSNIPVTAAPAEPPAAPNVPLKAAFDLAHTKARPTANGQAFERAASEMRRQWPEARGAFPELWNPKA